MKVKVIPIAIIAAIVLAGIGFWYWQKKYTAPSSPVGQTEAYTPEKAAGGLGENIYEKSQNPISDKLTETNPFGANINPFEEEANPLKVQYKNPFE